MKRLAKMAGVGALIAMGMSAQADPVDDTLILNDETEIVTRTAAPAHLSDRFDEILSGWLFRGDETRIMQADDFDNPGMIFVEQALEAWETADGTEGKSCSSCHNDIESMAGVKATYPKWNEAAGEVRTLQMQVNDCRTSRMGAEAWKYDKGDAINMEAALASVSRGLPVNVAIDGPAQSTWEQGRDLYYTRTGQLELSCANCHEDNYRSDDPRRSPEPGPDQRLSGLPPEEHQAERIAFPLQGLYPRHPRGNLCAGQPGIRGA